MVTSPSGLPPTHEKPSSKIASRLPATSSWSFDAPRRLLLLLEDLEHLHQELGVGEEVAADLGVERLALGGGEGRGPGALGGHLRHHDGRREGAGGRVLGAGRAGEGGHRGGQGVSRRCIRSSVSRALRTRWVMVIDILRPPPPRGALGQEVGGAAGVAVGVAEAALEREALGGGERGGALVAELRLGEGEVAQHAAVGVVHRRRPGEGVARLGDGRRASPVLSSARPRPPRISGSFGARATAAR